MKKLFYFLLACCLAASCIIALPARAKEKGKRKNVDIKLVHLPKTHIHRSALPLVEATYEEDEALHIEFNKDFGQVVILIIDPMQQVVVKYECLTDMEPYVFLPVSLDDMGIYTVKILGKGFEAIGYIE